MQFTRVHPSRFIAITGSVGITIATDHIAASAAAIAEMAAAIAVEAVPQGGSQ